MGYPMGTSRYYFYCSLDWKIIVNTNATFLDDKYINEHRSK